MVEPRTVRLVSVCQDFFFEFHNWGRTVRGCFVELATEKRTDSPAVTRVGLAVIRSAGVDFEDAESEKSSPMTASTDRPVTRNSAKLLPRIKLKASRLAISRRRVRLG